MLRWQCLKSFLYLYDKREALMVPTYGKRALLGTDPIGIAMPAEPYPFLLDIATAVVPRGKLEVYMKDKKTYTGRVGHRCRWKSQHRSF
jgi:LDH2 family malate/lactate/ureidoglycolate dehydrogenase